ncbi:MAG: DUF1127 domain-containing protein [Paracoccaceae bacterium]
MAIATTHSNGLLGTFSEFSYQWVLQTRSKLTAKLRQRAVYRTTFAELDALSDRDLDDLGITRFQIPSVAHDAAYGNK